MTLGQLLENDFRGDVRFRGQAYLEAERVAITHVTTDEIVAVVRDGQEFQTQLSRKQNQLRMFCNCTGGRSGQMSCKHLWATILAVDASQLMSGTPRAGYVPPFVVDDVPDFAHLGALEDLTDDLIDLEEENEPRPRAVRQRPEWELRLKEIRSSLSSDTRKTAAAAPQHRDVFYEIDAIESRNSGQLVVQTLQRQLRSDGQWGMLKPLRLRPAQIPHVDSPDDRKILALLAGATPERSDWHAQQAELNSPRHRYRLYQEISDQLIPLMCASGRLRLSDAGTESLAWDDGPPWELCVEVRSDEEENQWKLDGHLRRGDETLPIPEAVLLVPGGYVVTSTSIARLDDCDAFPWVDLFLNGDGICIPAGEENEFITRLLDMPALPHLILPQALQLEEVRVQPVPHLVVRSPNGKRWTQERLEAAVSFDYQGEIVDSSSTRQALVQPSQRRYISRDREFELGCWSALEGLGFRRLLDKRKGRQDVEISLRDIGSAMSSLMDSGWQVQAEGNKVHQPGELQFRISSGIDWFELHAEVDFDGVGIGLPELLSALARGDRTVKLSDGSLGILPEEWSKNYGPLAGLGLVEGDHVRFAANQVGLLDALLATEQVVHTDTGFETLRERLVSYTQITPATEPAGFSGSLRGYQQEGLGWLHFLHESRFGGCLADDMGLGKTVQVLALLQDRRDKGTKVHASLIVVPKSLVFNWKQEASRFTPGLKVMEYLGVNRAPLREEFKTHDIILTTYGTLRRDILHLREMRFDYVILDEAQAIKNSGSQAAKASRLLKAEHRLALSGTPIENHLGDLCSILEFLNPGMLGRSSLMKPQARDADDETSRRVLAQGLRPFILRRTKREVASELPEKCEQTLYCDLSRKHRQLYDELRDHYRAAILGLVREKGLATSKMHVLEALLRLRQAACHPALLKKVSKDESSAKLDVLCPRVEELLDEGHKVLIFSQFTSMLKIVRRHFDRREIVYEYLDGKTRDRKERVERFQNDKDCGVFLISLKAGGLGLNLTAADYVFVLDPWWNPAVETQAIDRAHRVGQTRQVFAYRLIARDTVEEKIAQLQSRKRDLAEAILQDNNRVMKDLSMEDLEMLLS